MVHSVERARELRSGRRGTLTGWTSYVDHTGVPSWLQRAWAGVLFAWPAALWNTSPPRLRTELAVLQLASRATDDFGAVRAHALPTAARQVRDSIRGPVYRDVLYGPRGLSSATDVVGGSLLGRDPDRLRLLAAG